MNRITWTNIGTPAQRQYISNRHTAPDGAQYYADTYQIVRDVNDVSWIVRVYVEKGMNGGRVISTQGGLESFTDAKAWAASDLAVYVM